MAQFGGGIANLNKSRPEVRRDTDNGGGYSEVFSLLENYKSQYVQVTDTVPPEFAKDPSRLPGR